MPPSPPRPATHVKAQPVSLTGTDISTGCPPGAGAQGPLAKPGLLGSAGLPAPEDPRLLGRPAQRGASHSGLPFFPGPFVPGGTAAAPGAMNVNSPLSLGAASPTPFLPTATGQWGLGLHGPELSLEAGFVCEVHLQGWEELPRPGERPGLGMLGCRQGETWRSLWKKAPPTFCKPRLFRPPRPPSSQFSVHLLSSVSGPFFPVSVFVLLGLLMSLVALAPHHMSHTSLKNEHHGEEMRKGSPFLLSKLSRWDTKASPGLPSGQADA